MTSTIVTDPREAGMRLVTLAPVDAQEWAATCRPGTHRRVSASNVRRFTDLIETGNWLSDESRHDPVVFDTLGILRHGLMRVVAIANATKPASIWAYFPPQPLESETVPASYIRDGKAFADAIRFSGGNHETIIDWMEQAPHNIAALMVSEPCVLRLEYPQHTSRFPETVYPGDWIVSDTAGYEVWDHHRFTGRHARTQF